jgi:hypothetical protein
MNFLFNNVEEHFIKSPGTKDAVSAGFEVLNNQVKKCKERFGTSSPCTQEEEAAEAEAEKNKISGQTESSGPAQESKLLDFTTKNDVYGIYKYTGNENYYFKINVNKAGNKCNINYKDVKNINSSLYNDIISEGTSSNIIQGSNSNTFSILGNNGIFGKFTLSSDVNNQKKSSDMFGDVFGYALNRLYLLFPNNLYDSYDKNASNLYILASNKLYELIFSLIFIIFLIIAILITLDILISIFKIFFLNNSKVSTDKTQDEVKSYEQQFKSMVGNANDKNYTPQSLMLIKPEYIYLIIIPIFIIIYCIIHSVIYYYFFVNGAYYKISELYNNLIIPDEIIRNDVLKCLNKNIVIDPGKKIVNKELLLLFQNIAYGKEIDISKGKYYVIDISANDYKVQQKNFENKMLDINKYFTYSKNIHDANYYTFEFFEEFKKLYNELKNNYKHIHKDLSGKNDIQREHNTEEYFIKIMKLLLTIYIYFIEWNNNDPYILIKLNKLIFGRVANIGIPEIDEDIENTLTFRDIIPYHLNDYREPNIVDIYRGVCNFLDGIDDAADTKRNDDGTYTFKDSTFVLNKFKEAFDKVRRSKLDGPEYSLNLYLAFEMGLNIFIILIILILLKIMSNGDDSEFNKNITFTQTLATWIVAQIAISIFGIINVLRFV